MLNFVRLYIFFVLFLAATADECPQIDVTRADVRLTISVSRLCRGSVKNSRTIRFLNLEASGIEILESGAFENVPNLYEVNLALNSIEVVPVGVFNFLNVRSVFLNNNSIVRIERNAFDNMTYLTYVQLEYNKLKEIDSDWFKNSPRVFSVFYNHNTITTIPEGAYKNFVKTFEIPIFLMNNAIESIHPDAFDGLTKIGDVYLSRNRIKELNDTFPSAEYVRNVYLDFNELECLSEGFKMTPLVGSINVEGNPLRCDCLLDLEYWTQLYNLTLIVNPDKIDRCYN